MKRSAYAHSGDAGRRAIPLDAFQLKRDCPKCDECYGTDPVNPGPHDCLELGGQGRTGNETRFAARVVGWCVGITVLGAFWGLIYLIADLLARATS